MSGLLLVHSMRGKLHLGLPAGLQPSPWITLAVSHQSQRGQPYLDDFGVQLALGAGLVQDGLLDGAGTHQHQDQHVPLLPDPVGPVLSL